jgi:ABC-2 type transport system permease protein
MNGLLSIAQPASRVARPDPMPARRIVHAYFSEAKYEFLRLLRTPAFAVPILVLPIVVYLLFGVVMANEAITKNPAVGVYLFCGFSVFAVIGPGLLGVGISLALERDAGLLKLKRALPAPPGAYILAKMLMAMVFATLTTASMLVMGVLIAKVALTTGQLAALAGVMVLGTVPMCAIGLFIGAHTSGSAAPAFANLVFLPMMWLSGLFIPLPAFLQKWAVIWPAFHLNQVALGVIGAKQFSFMPVTQCIGVLVGVTVLFGGLAIRRLARTG